jgi:hypothetical protein
MVHPMAEFLLYANMSCTDADQILINIRKHLDLSAQTKVELIETVKESVPECQHYWDAND